ncbi:hemolysin family protein [Aetokthonos hydrillicola Thurmond2011]|jgi:putative hemolysin|uniref:Hemolysin family protein n=1 Tax=Aetokthonos hydrillicola Thurmond2011 TaxID=2712845 RepID=A0AAP5IC90_9CYAN|nr:hemolysin family protein [Aetokthonos hydrillicola]MBW4586931.1 hemolysin family protein [Aetokthonos hydrillicola CCALA 1050]MDR9897594.1 hemolysin family protein [Aetokthonos hydrillicola Thurmond2011]
MSPTIEILIILLLVLANGLFVMSELAIISARKVRLQQLANHGDAKARVALQLASSPNQFLATVQIGITLLAILSGAFGESVIAKRLVYLLSFIPGLQSYKQAIASVLAILIVTYLTLIIGELVPKRLALNNPEPIASIVAIPMQWLSTIAAPIAYLLGFSTDTVLRLLGIRPSREPQVTEEEIRVLIEQGTEEGTFEEAEQDMVERVFRLGDRPVSSFMTPRPDIVWLDLEDSIEENRQKIIDGGYSRYPVCQGELDNVLGIIPVTDLLVRSFRNEKLDLTVGLRQAVFVPESTRGLKVLELFKQTVTHMALVVDEYGVIQGLVTLNDVMIEIVGDVPSDDQLQDPQIVRREDGSWLLDGMLSVDEFFELFNMEELQQEGRGSYQTLGGFVINHLGRIPAVADHFEWQKMRFEVMDMDGNRVDKVLVVPKQDSSVGADS